VKKSIDRLNGLARFSSSVGRTPRGRWFQSDRRRMGFFFWNFQSKLFCIPKNRKSKI